MRNDTNVAAPQEGVGKYNVTSDVCNIEGVSDNMSINFTGAIVIGHQVKIQCQGADTTTKELTTHSLQADRITSRSPKICKQPSAYKVDLCTSIFKDLHNM